MAKHRNQPAGREPGDGKAGYKNIDPKHRWLKGGPSPNPRGRAVKKPPSLRDEFYGNLAAVLQSKIPAGDGELAVFDAITRRLLSAAVTDPKIALRVVPMIAELLTTLEPNRDRSSDNLSGEDASIIAETLCRLSRSDGPVGD